PGHAGGEGRAETNGPSTETERRGPGDGRRSDGRAARRRGTAIAQPNLHGVSNRFIDVRHRTFGVHREKQVPARVVPGHRRGLAPKDREPAERRDRRDTAALTLTLGEPAVPRTE